MSRRRQDFSRQPDRLQAYLDALTQVAGHADRVVPIKNYAKGLLLPIERARHSGHEASPGVVVGAGSLSAKPPRCKACGDSDGLGAEWLRANAQGIEEDVLTLLPFQPYGRLSEVLRASDVLIALLDSKASQFAIPSKIPAYLCAGRALIVAAPRENQAAAIVEQVEAGIVISPDNSNDIVSAAKELMENSGLCTRYAKNARIYADRAFDIVSIGDRFLQVIQGSSISTSDPVLTAQPSVLSTASDNEARHV